VTLPVRLTHDLVDAVSLGPLRGDPLDAGAAAVHQDEVGILGAGPVEAADDGAWVGDGLAAGDGDQGAGCKVPHARRPPGECAKPRSVDGSRALAAPAGRRTVRSSGEGGGGGTPPARTRRRAKGPGRWRSPGAEARPNDIGGIEIRCPRLCGGRDARTGTADSRRLRSRSRAGGKRAAGPASADDRAPGHRLGAAQPPQAGAIDVRVRPPWSSGSVPRPVHRNNLTPQIAMFGWPICLCLHRKRASVCRPRKAACAPDKATSRHMSRWSRKPAASMDMAENELNFASLSC